LPTRNHAHRAPLVGLSAVLLCASIIAADAKPLSRRGGNPGGGSSGGVAQACDPVVTSTCAQFQDGQTFVTWSDVNQDAAGDQDRYEVVRSTAPITEANYASATVIGTHILNNSAQSQAGNRTATRAGLTESTDSEYSIHRPMYRADPDNPMLKLTDLGTEQPIFSGLMVHTAEGTENAYYAVSHFPRLSPGTKTFLGAVGPIAETVQPWRMYKQRDSTEPSRSSIAGAITAPTAGKAAILQLHPANGSGTCNSINCQYGDLWAGFMDKNSGHWQEGLPRYLTVAQLTSSIPGGSLTIKPTETISQSTGGLTFSGDAGMQGFWSGLGMSPLSYVGPANRRYLGTQFGLEKQLAWLVSNYGLDENQIHHRGSSMGAMGIASTSRFTNPSIAAAWILQPVWKMYERSSVSWVGDAVAWTTGSPFIATHNAVTGVATTAGSTLGTNAAQVLVPDGTAWGGTGGYADLPTRILDLSQPFPPVFWGANQHDLSILGTAEISWGQQVEAMNAFQTARRAHGLAWTLGNHDTRPHGVLDCDESAANLAVCVPKESLRRDQAHFAFSNSSIDDDVGSATFDSNRVPTDGVMSGCVNCGFRWTIATDTAGSFVGTVDNTWMHLQPTINPTTTLTATIPDASGAGTVGVADGSVFGTPPYGGTYMLVGQNTGNSEFMIFTGISGNTLSYASRTTGGTFSSGRKAHSSGESVVFYKDLPTGPVNGPFTTMTVDMALWNLQGGAWGSKTCVFTPNGGSPTAPQTPTILSNGVPLFTGVTINASGSTSIACS
jgi:hypothetical protein